MKNRETPQELLVRSYDAPLTGEEQQRLQEALAHSADLQQEKNAWDQLRKNLADYHPDFSPGFTDNLMNRLTVEMVPAFHTVFRFVMLSGAAAILLVLLSVYFKDGSLNLDSLMGIKDYAPDMGEWISLF
jgi:hypothetical protein